MCACACVGGGATKRNILYMGTSVCGGVGVSLAMFAAYRTSMLLIMLLAETTVSERTPPACKTKLSMETKGELWE